METVRSFLEDNSAPHIGLTDPEFQALTAQQVPETQAAYLVEEAEQSLRLAQLGNFVVITADGKNGSTPGGGGNKNGKDKEQDTPKKVKGKEGEKNLVLKECP